MYRHNLVLLILLSTAATGWAGADSYFDERVHDFGATPRGPLLVHHFRFTNKGSETLNISSVRVSCGCVTASAPVAQIKAGETSYITAQMDSRRFTGAKSVTIYVQFTAPVFEEISLQVQANGRDDFTMTSDTIAFGQINKGSSPKAGIQISLVGDPNWQITDIKPDSNYVLPVATMVKRNGAEVSYDISATLRRDLPVGKWYTDIWLQTTNPSLSKVRVSLTVDVNAPLSATPAVVLFGDVKVGGAKEQNVLIRGDKPFRIKTIKANDGAESLVHVSEIGAEAKAIHVLKFKFKPEKPGEVNRTVSIITDEGEDSTVTIPIRGKGVDD